MNEFVIKVFESKKAIWANVEGENLQYVGMKGDEELTLQEGSKVIKLFKWPGGVPEYKHNFEEGLRRHLDGEDNLILLYER